MRLTTFGNGRPGTVLSDGTILDLAAYWADGAPAAVPVPQAVASLLRDSTALDAARAVTEAAERARASGGAALPVSDAAALTFQPTWVPGRIYAIGLNYRSHAEEQGARIPKNPIVFTKAVSSLTGHGSPIVSPAATEQLDYEAELAVVIGQPCANVGRDEAMAYVAGYTCLNDVSARDIQRADRQWFRSKSYPTFSPLGRDLVTADEVKDPAELVVSCVVNGEQRQSAPVSDLIFDIPELIAFLSSFVTLEPGDVIATGTPSGVGFAMDPPRFLAPGDVVTCEVGGITTLRNEVTSA
jgi:2-keto-4-pentenoate hydratase/2-oxohepta-3-ene-1,7-dioic acid hydratase in catechol pathway